MKTALPRSVDLNIESHGMMVLALQINAFFCHFNVLPQMFPAVISTKLEAAIGHEEERKRKELEQRKKRMGEDGQAKKGVPSSEFELLLNEYSKLEAEEIAVRMRYTLV